MPEGGLPAWMEKTSSQSLKEEGYPGWMLEGRGTQLYIPNSRQSIPKNLEKKLTHWSKE